MTKRLIFSCAVWFAAIGCLHAAAPGSEWVSVPFKRGIPESFQAVSESSVRVVRVLGHENVAGYQALLDATDETGVVIEGCSTGLVNELVFKLQEPVGLVGIRCLVRKETGGIREVGEIEVYVSDQLGEWGPPVRCSNLSGSSPFISFPEKRGRFVKLIFQPIVWDKETDTAKVEIAECTFYRAGLVVHIDDPDVDGRLLVDGRPDTSISLQYPAKLRVVPTEPKRISGISLLFDAPVDEEIAVRVMVLSPGKNKSKTVFEGRVFEGVDAIGSVDGRMCRSFFFDEITADQVGLVFTSRKTVPLKICELQLLESQKIEGPVGSCTVRLDPGQRIRPVSPRVFGANIEYWLDDDSVLNDPRFAQRVQETGITVLRYPGGTESDRYLWKEHRLYNKAYWPFIDGPQTTDTDEMMAFAKKVGAEVILCVNTEYAFFEKDWEKGADYAAEWVKYCKDKGYKIKYWTIGNEMYWKFHFTAKDYARLVRLYATKMKAVDPSITIAAAGETGLRFVGRKDKVVGEGFRLLDELQDRRERLEVSPEVYQKQADGLFEKYSNPNPDLWWPSVFDVAGDLIDMVEVHLYPSSPKKTFMSPHYAEELRALKEYAEDRTGRPFSLAVTEWNLYNSSGAGKDSEGMEQGLYVGEFLGSLLHGGVDLATFWPMTMRGNWIQKSFYVEKHHDVLPSFYGFALAANNLSGDLIASTSSHDGYYTMASRDAEEGKTTLLVYGRPQAETPAFTEMVIDLSGAAFKNAVCTHIELLHAPDKRSFAIQRLEPRFGQAEGKLRFIMPRYAMAVITVVDR